MRKVTCEEMGGIHMRDDDGWDQGGGSGGGKEQASSEAILRVDPTGLVIG